MSMGGGMRRVRGKKSWQNTPFTQRASAGINMLFYRPGSFGRMAFEEIAGKSLFTGCQKSLPVSIVFTTEKVLIARNSLHPHPRNGKDILRKLY